ncbi:hypothetical protein COV16_00600 [Candidatus Woesearchaeota archaeon CG10_big_fil_rev_8_21_14_0_10_34_8]|nr:MAG: hypothetical protein COV16_00600 [Candidatus Woesearchaeota archaeon CG10_big_fil_rev_8_21_14_0_10_34_8]
MNINYRKIASIIASAVMIGSSVGIAAAASYPAPFVSGGKADVAVVVGGSAASSDYLAAVNVGQNLQVELAKQTATTGASTGATATGGDSINLATSARKLYYGDGINAARQTLTKGELPTILADGSFVDLSGIQYSYTQSITPGDTVSVLGTSGGDLDDPALYLDVGTTSTDPLYNYTLTFTKNVNVSDSTNVQGQKIKIAGVDYVIGSSSTNTTLYLYGSGDTATIAGGESKTVTVAGKEHVVELITTSSTTQAKIAVDGVSKTVTKGSKYAFAGDVVIYVKDVTHPAYAGDIRNAELIIGANTLTLANGASITQGADDTTIKGTKASITPSGNGLISGFTVQVAAAQSKVDDISIGSSFEDPIFGGLKVEFAGVVPDLDDENRAKIIVDTDNNQFARVTFTSALAGSKGEQRITYIYDNATASTSVQPLLAHQTIASGNSKGRIHVIEGEAAKEGDWIVVNPGDFGRILEVDTITVNTAASGTVKFVDAITGESQTATITNDTNAAYSVTTNLFDGQSYTIRTNQAGTTVNLTWSSADVISLFPRIKLKSGGWIAFLEEANVPNGTSAIFPDGLTTLATTGTELINTTLLYQVNGVMWGMRNSSAVGDVVLVNNVSAGSGGSCNFNTTIGPSVLYLEPKKWDDSTYGNFICIPLTTTGTTEIAIGDPIFNGTSSGFQTLTSDTYKKVAVDKYGTYVVKEDRTNENGIVTLTIPASQMYLDVLFTDMTATVTAGSSSGGSVSELGSVTVEDSEVSSVSGKNLIVVGGSCVNSVAANLVGAAACGADFTEATGIGSGQFLLKVYESPYTTGKIAMLVAGYEAADTTKAVDYMTKETPLTDVDAVVKKVTTTLADVA